MAKLEEVANHIIDTLRSKGIQVALESESTFTLKDTPEFVIIVPEKLKITDTIRFDGGMTFRATLVMRYKVVCDKDHVNTTDLDCRVASIISKNHEVQINEIYSVITNTFNKYIVDMEVKNIGWTQFD